MKSNRLNSTAAFSLIQSSFWMSFCVAVCFAVPYLQEIGFNNTELGWITAAGSLTGVILGPLLASLLDRSRRWTAVSLTPVILLAQFACALALLLVRESRILTCAVYPLYMAFCNTLNTMNLKIYEDAVHRGAEINYSLARGIGSGSYVVISVLLGIFMESFSVRAVPIAGMLMCLYQFAAFLAMRRRMPGESIESEKQEPVSLAKFISGNRRFCIMLAGTALLFIPHNIVSNFMINIARNVGGDAETMGILNGLTAMMEIPVMVFYARVFGKRNQAVMMRLSFVVFTVKAAAIAMAGSIPALTASLILQAPSYAVYTSAVVPYVESVIDYKDSAKAQSLAFTMTSVGAMLASIIGGRLFDMTTVSGTLWIACVISVIGTVVSILGTENRTRTAGQR